MVVEIFGFASEEKKRVTFWGGEVISVIVFALSFFFNYFSVIFDLGSIEL